METKKLSGAEAEIKRRSRRAFMVLGGGMAAGITGFALLNRGGEEGDIPPALRGILGMNERVVRSAVYSNAHMVKTYPASAIGDIKKNGDVGMDDEVDLAAWRLNVIPYGKSPAGAQLTMDAVRALPRYEQTIDFKCVEGWSCVTQFAGARLSDFTAKFAPGSEKAQCVGMMTPDEEYYVGIDMPSALHPQ
ncbi:MAG: molybdopterin-dependent oxidoreductase, partial [Acidobacteriota bacterium]|nr:molybdopterin-dependent oxidoreductase [Acidobacteriota bacterium]